MEDKMDAKDDLQAHAANIDATAAKIAALETMVAILLGKLTRAEIGILEEMKMEIAQMQERPERRNDAQLRAADDEMLKLLERGINSASSTGGQAYRLRLWLRQAVQRWRG